MGKNKMLAQEVIHDPDATAREAKYIVKGDTGIIMDDFMEHHFSPWDENHVEKPEREDRVVCDKYKSYSFVSILM